MVVLEHEVGHAPDLERPILGRREQMFSVGRKTDGDDRTLVGEPRVPRRVARRGLKRNDRPEMNPLVAARRDHVPAVGRECHGKHLRQRLLERVETDAVGRPPELHRLVSTRGSEKLPGRMPGEVEDRPVVDVDRAEQRAVGNVPELDRPVIAGRRQRQLVGGEFGVVEEVSMAPERPDELPGRRVADFGDSRQARDPTRDHEPLPVAAEMHRRRRAGKIFDRAEPGTGGIDDIHRTATAHRQPRAVGSLRGGRHRLGAGVGRERRHDERPQDRRIDGGAGRAGRDPGLEHGLVGRRHLRLVIRGHVVAGGAPDPLDHRGGGRITGHDRIPRLSTAPAERRERLDRKSRLVVAIVVAAGAVDPQDGRDVAVVRGRRRARQGCEQAHDDCVLHDSSAGRGTRGS